MNTPAEVLRVFVSYRRSDTQEFVPLLAHALQGEMPGARIFVDESGIRLGRYPRQLADQLAACHLMLVVMGPDWLSSFQTRASRTEDFDWVLHEVTEALRSDKYIVPVLVDDTEVPRAAKLPEALRPLVAWQACRVRQTSFDADVLALAGKIRELDVASPLRDRAPERSARDRLGDAITRLLHVVQSNQLDLQQLHSRAREIHRLANHTGGALGTEQRALFESAGQLIPALRAIEPEIWAFAQRTLRSVFDPAVVQGQALSEVLGALMTGRADQYAYENLARVFRTAGILLEVAPRSFDDALARSDYLPFVRPAEASLLVVSCDGHAISLHFASDTGLVAPARTLRARASQLHDVQLRVSLAGDFRLYARDDRTVYRWALSDGRLEREYLIPEQDLLKAFSGLRVLHSPRAEFVCWSGATSWLKLADRPELVEIPPPNTEPWEADAWRNALEDDEGTVLTNTHFGGGWSPQGETQLWSKVIVRRFSWRTGAFGATKEWDAGKGLHHHNGSLGQTAHGDARQLRHAYTAWPVRHRHRVHLAVTATLDPAGHALFLVDERTGACYWPPFVEHGVFADVAILTHEDRELLVAAPFGPGELHVWDVSEPRKRGQLLKVATWPGYTSQVKFARIHGEPGALLVQAIHDSKPGSRLALLTVASSRFIEMGEVPRAQIECAMRLPVSPPSLDI